MASTLTSSVELNTKSDNDGVSLNTRQLHVYLGFLIERTGLSRRASARFILQGGRNVRYAAGGGKSTIPIQIRSAGKVWLQAVSCVYECTSRQWDSIQTVGSRLDKNTTRWKAIGISGSAARDTKQALLMSELTTILSSTSSSDTYAQMYPRRKPPVRTLCWNSLRLSIIACFYSRRGLQYADKERLWGHSNRSVLERMCTSQEGPLSHSARPIWPVSRSRQRLRYRSRTISGNVYKEVVVENNQKAGTSAQALLLYSQNIDAIHKSSDFLTIT